MGALSIWHLLAVAAVVTLLFGGQGRLSSVMGDAAKGLKAFRQGLKDEDEPAKAAAAASETARGDRA